MTQTFAFQQDISDPPNATYAYVRAFVTELQRAGLCHVVICPGSRSTPLAMVFAAQTQIRLWMHIDERSAAFFALGMAKRLQQPVALLCTSGTAAANFFPAIVEAYLSHVPLLVITADRPPELRDCGAPQAINQNRLYGTFVKWFVELALPETTQALLLYIRTIAQRALACTHAVPAGPVHLNFPLREPLVPVVEKDQSFPPAEVRDPLAWQGRADGASYVTIYDAPPGLPTEEQTLRLAQRLRSAKRGLIIVGPQDQEQLATTLLPLARYLNYPILADPLSQLRCSEQELVIASYDAFLRSPHLIDKLAPDLILRFGAMPTSKPLLLYLKGAAAGLQVVIDGHLGWEEPTQLAAELIHTNPTAFCAHVRSCLEILDLAEGEISHEGNRVWTRLWQEIDQCSRRVLLDTIGDFQDLFEGRVFTELAALLPDRATLYVGNSMPIRDMDTFFWPRGHELRLLGNRGANGIDGLTSSAFGASAVADPQEPTLLVIGDLSFLHDLNGLLAAALHHLNLTIILINNDGGGIFSFLPQSAYPEHFEQLFGTPVDLDFQHIGQMYRANFQRVVHWEQFRNSIQRAMSESGLHILEVRTERNSNVQMHRHLWQVLDQEMQFKRLIEE
jgi:2-succinyl-5-enolpyruvyl-6-hydroxy-3-cyclohexene-1-carboxylate synthase